MLYNKRFIKFLIQAVVIIFIFIILLLLLLANHGKEFRLHWDMKKENKKKKERK
jgi:uncharacterized membrane protein